MLNKIAAKNFEIRPLTEKEWNKISALFTISGTTCGYVCRELRRTDNAPLSLREMRQKGHSPDSATSAINARLRQDGSPFRIVWVKVNSRVSNHLLLALRKEPVEKRKPLSGNKRTGHAL